MAGFSAMSGIGHRNPPRKVCVGKCRGLVITCPRHVPYNRDRLSWRSPTTNRASRIEIMRENGFGVTAMVAQAGHSARRARPLRGACNKEVAGPYRAAVLRWR
jgi:hypothetical protein